MERIRFITEDGSTSFRLDEWEENYHSSHGAVTESLHVFIDNGFAQLDSPSLTIFEMGFGTGLNAALTWYLADQVKKNVHYVTVEKYPLIASEFQSLHFGERHSDLYEINQRLHQVSWNEQHNFTDYFAFTKKKEDLHQVNLPEQIDLVYYDAFSPEHQPDLWTLEIFNRLFHCMTSKGIFVTYSAKGQVRRDLIAAGFEVERIPGPPGKRQMIRAIKP